MQTPSTCHNIICIILQDIRIIFSNLQKLLIAPITMRSQHTTTFPLSLIRNLHHYTLSMLSISTRISNPPNQSPLCQIRRMQPSSYNQIICFQVHTIQSQTITTYSSYFGDRLHSNTIASTVYHIWVCTPLTHALSHAFEPVP